MSRILYVSQGYSTHDKRFLEELSQSAHDIWFLPFADSAFRLESRPIPLGVSKLPPLMKNKAVPSAFEWPALLWRFRKRVRDVKPDIVHAGPVQTGAFLAALCKSAPLLVMSWGSDLLVLPDKNQWMTWVTKFTLKRADMVLGDCQAVRDSALRLSSLEDERILFFPWGIDLHEFMPGKSKIRLREKLNWKDCFVIIHTRAFEEIHGPLVFLKAVKRVVEASPDVRVIMVGSGGLRCQIERFIDQNGLSGYISLPGRIPNPELVDYFNEADLYVSATFSDGASVSLLEAMGCGLPVVVVDGCGNREWVVPEENGWLYPPGDADILGETILEAHQKKRERARMSRENRALMEERANWKENVGQLFLAYDRLLG